MRYNNTECSVCGKKFDDNSDVVVCPDCGTPYHRECWMSVGRCIHSDEHASGYRWEAPKTESADRNEELDDAAEKEKLNDAVFKNGEAVVICPHCGAANFENDMFCRDCHAPLKENNVRNNGFGQNDGGCDSAPGQNGFFGFGSMPGNDGSEEYRKNTEAMYNSFNMYGGLDPDSLVDGIPVKEYSAYIGGKTPGRIIRKISTLERYGKSFAPCFGGLLGPIWFFRRKMIKAGAIMSAVIIALCTFAGIMQVNDAYRSMVGNIVSLTEEVKSGKMYSTNEMRAKMEDIITEYHDAGRTHEEAVREKIAGQVYYLVIYAAPVVGYISAIGIYRADIRKKILKIRSECSDMNTYMGELQRQGGTSSGLTVLGVLAFGFAMFMFNYFPMILVLLK